MKLKDLKVVYICPDHDDKYRARRAHMEELLTRIGFSSDRIEHFKSSTENYPDCLAKANIEILTKYMNEPVLILEDDVEFTGVEEFDMIKEADAIYFGLSTSAGHPTHNIHHGLAQYTCYSESQVRIWNMLATHAILYISATYKAAVIKTIEEHTDFIRDIVVHPTLSYLLSCSDDDTIKMFDWDK
jgi:WD40 repeat protein